MCAYFQEAMDTETTKQITSDLLKKCGRVVSKECILRYLLTHYITCPQ